MSEHEDGETANCTFADSVWLSQLETGRFGRRGWIKNLNNLWDNCICKTN